MNFLGRCHGIYFVHSWASLLAALLFFLLFVWIIRLAIGPRPFHSFRSEGEAQDKRAAVPMTSPGTAHLRPFHIFFPNKKIFGSALALTIFDAPGQPLPVAMVTASARCVRRECSECEYYKGL